MSDPPPIPPAVPPSASSSDPSTPNTTRGRHRNRRGGGRNPSSAANNGEVNSSTNKPAPNGHSSRGGGRKGGRGSGENRAQGGPGRPPKNAQGGGLGQNQASTSQDASGASSGATPSLDAPPHTRPHSHPHPPSNNHRSAGPSNRQDRSSNQPKNSRKSRFNAALSSNTLTAEAAPFVPPSSVAQADTPSPADQTLLARLTTELSNGTYDCSICFSSLSRSTAIHSCSTCYTAFHLTCLSKWAIRSSSESLERAEALAQRQNSTVPSSAGHWRCPGCQTAFPPDEIPKEYRCFCGRVKDPAYKQNATPHSCALQCARKRPEGCPHPCALACHPGPCPPCGIVMKMNCHCGKENLSVRCSMVNGKDVNTQELLSCKMVCGKKRACGLHECEDICHEGPCGTCEVEREKICYCGKDKVEESCGEERDAQIECWKPEGEKSWMGEYTCEKKCDVAYDCGKHRCEQSCHPHTSPSPLPCPLSPDSLTHCPCGTNPLSSLLSSPRTTCESPVPTCSSPCPKLLNCGHSCGRSCHHGECGSCDEIVTVICRCSSSKTTRRCGDITPETPEFTCDRICRAMKHCGRHECGRRCCPLQYQEAVKGKKGKRQVVEIFGEESDPIGYHVCPRTCGRTLGCGIHTCEQKDHRGPCPPCLMANFDELVCHCGSTVILPPIACNTVMDCRFPCARQSSCGHPPLPHACHENPDCPPCPFLMAKSCACGKKQVGNVRCSQDPKKVSCGTPCGKLLRCGYHRCQKTCHLDACENCEQVCLKPRRLCSHPCPEPCHAPSACPIDEPCPKLIDVTCACGHIKQRARCATSESRPEGNRDRHVKCNDSCAIAKRNAALAEALGVENKEAKIKEVAYDSETLAFYAANTPWASQIESLLIEFVESDKPSFHFPVMKRPQRQFTHELAELFGLRGESLDEEPRRSVVVHRQQVTGIPSPNLADALAAQRKTASTVLSFGNLRKVAPERASNNAIYLESVLGFDESMLKDVLRPKMRGLPFVLSWATDDDVIISFTATPPDLDSKLNHVQHSLQSLAEETGFCSIVEAVSLADDGSITRGSWTPVATASSSRSANYSAGSVYSRNAFAALGGDIPAPKPKANAWAAGSLMGTGFNKAPRAVVATPSSEERPAPPPVRSLATAPARTATPPVVPVVDREEVEVPDSWEEDEETEAEEKKVEGKVEAEL